MKTEELLSQIGDVLDDWEVGPDAMRCNAPADVQPPPPRPSITFLDESHLLVLPPATAPWLLPPTPAFGVFDGAAGRFGEWLSEHPLPHFLLTDWQRDFLDWMYPTVPVTRFRRRSGPEPLPIDGRAYHQRQRNRRRR